MKIRHTGRVIKTEAIKQLGTGTVFKLGDSYCMKVLNPETTSGFTVVDLVSGFLHTDLAGNEEVIPLDCELIIYDN